MSSLNLYAQPQREFPADEPAPVADRFHLGNGDVSANGAGPAERLLRFTLAITQILAESPRLNTAFQAVLRTAAETLGWDVGAVWLPDSEAKILRCIEIWNVPNAQCAQFKAASFGRTFAPGAGLPGRVWSTSKPLWVQDVTKDDNFPRGPIAVFEGLHGAFAFPILCGDKVIGVMEFFSGEIRSPDERLLAVFAILGGQLGQFIERKRAEEKLAEAARVQQALYAFVERRHRAETLAEIYDSALEALVAALRCDRASILLFDNSGVMRFVGSTGLSAKYREAAEGHSPWKADEPNPGPIFVCDIGKADISESLKAAAREEGIGSLAFIPLVANGRLIGKFTAYFNEPHPFSGEEEELTLTIARQLALGIERKTAEEALQRSEAKLCDFMENASVGLHWVGPDGVILWANQAELDLLGYARAEYVGRHIAEFHADSPVIEDILQRLMAGETIENREARLRCKDGSTRHVVINSNVLWENGKFIHTRCFTRDITERKEAEERLRENERRFREMIDALPAAIYTTDAQGRITHFNSACVEFSGRTPELGSDHWCVTWKLFHPDGRPMPHDQCPMALALKEGRVVRGTEAIAERPDGTRIWFTPYPTPLRDADGRIIGGINMLVEITERKQAEEAKAKLAAIVESSDDAIVGKNLDGIITSWNRGAERIFGYTTEEAIGQHVTMLIPVDRQKEEPAILERLKRGERVDHYETVRVHKDGSRLDVSLTISPVKDAAGRIVGASKIARDITERKQTEQALRESEARYRQLANLLPVALYTCDGAGKITYYNPQAAQLWGRAPTPGDTDERFCGSEQLVLPNGQVLPHDQCPMAIALQDGSSFREQTVGIRRPDGSRITVRVNIDPIKDDAGRITGAINVFHDVTDLQRAEQALRESEEQLAAELADSQLLQGISAAIVQEENVEALYQRIMDAAVAIMHAEYASMQMLYPERGTGGELRLLAFRGFNPAAAKFWEWVRADSESTCGAALRSGQRVIAGDVEKCQFMAGTEDLATYLQTGIHAVQTTPLLSRNGRMVGMISTHWRNPHRPSERDLRLLDILARQAADLIERKQAEDALREAHALLADKAKHLEVLVQERTAKLQETVTELETFSYSVSHDLRSPLRAMQAYSNIVAESAASRLSSQEKEYLDRIDRAALRLDRLTQDVLAYSRVARSEISLQPVNLEKLLYDTIEQYPQILEQRSSIVIQSPLLIVMAHESSMAQALSNLLSNALKFARAGVAPKIRVWTEETMLDSQPAAKLVVEDNGIGIAPEHANRIFQMFGRIHPDKQYGGTGIGLTIVKKAIERMGGAVGYDSEVGKGSRFWMVLRRA